jgi:hypothetical protein
MNLGWRRQRRLGVVSHNGLSASAQAASTAGEPSLSTVARMSTIC